MSFEDSVFDDDQHGANYQLELLWYPDDDHFYSYCACGWHYVSLSKQEVERLTKEHTEAKLDVA